MENGERFLISVAGFMKGRMIKIPGKERSLWAM